MAREKSTTRDDVNQGDVRATVIDDPRPRASNPQTYDGGEVLPADAGIDYNAAVDNTQPKDAPAPAEVYTTATIPARDVNVRIDKPEVKQLKGAHIRLTARSYIGDVLYEEGAEIESYSGPQGPHMELVK